MDMDQQTHRLICLICQNMNIHMSSWEMKAPKTKYSMATLLPLFGILTKPQPLDLINDLKDPIDTTF